MTTVRCYFEGGPDTDPADLIFVRVPNMHEIVVYADHQWSVVIVMWTSDGPILRLSLIV